MEHVRRNNMVGVSNNSQVTWQLTDLLNSDKLTDDDRRLFNQWLGIVRAEHQSEINRAKRSVGFGIHY